jgi:peptidoglycan/LPS O-acetylase OafA/YrhL
MGNLINKSGLRIEEFDGLRGLAVSMVLIWHFVGCMIDQSLGSWAKVVFDITIFGRTGVDLFFVLSGFLITGIVLDRSSDAKSFFQSFYIRRVLRIVPSYMVLVSVYWLIVAAGKNNYAFNTETPIMDHLTFTQNWWMSSNEKWGPAAISVTWSVAIEEQFYLFFPIILLIASLVSG